MSNVINGSITALEQRVMKDLYWTGLSRRGMIWLLPHPLRLSLQQVVSLSQSSCVSLVKLTEGKGGGVGEAPNNIMRESLVLYKSFNTLCSTVSDVAGIKPIITLSINRITLLVRFISPVFSFTFSVLTLLVIDFVTIFRIIKCFHGRKKNLFIFFLVIKEA
jgi:hypothetical protein